MSGQPCTTQACPHPPSPQYAWPTHMEAKLLCVLLLLILLAWWHRYGRRWKDIKLRRGRKPWEDE